MKRIEPISRLVTRRKIQVVLGLLWLFDGALQLQKQMFTSSFANHVISPAAIGQPLIVSGPIHFEVHVLLMHPALFDSFFALTQLLLGVLILFRRTSKIGLVGSALWALMVWYLGEGLGGLLGLHTILLMGAPGAVILYAFLAMAVLPKKSKDTTPAFWLPLLWSILWVSGAIYQLLPGQNTASDISSMILNNSSSAPNWIASLDIHAVNLINKISHVPQTASMHMSALQMSHMQTQTSSGYWFIVLLFVLQLLVGLLILIPGRFRITAIILGIVISLVFWVYGQSLGNYNTGVATDPQSAPLFILLGVSILGCVQISAKKLFHDSYSHLEKFIT